MLDELYLVPERVNETNEGEDTPLTYACWKENWDVAKILIRHGANVNSKDAVCVRSRLVGSSLFWLSLECSMDGQLSCFVAREVTMKWFRFCWSMVQILQKPTRFVFLKFSSEVFICPFQYNWTPLMWASWQGHKSTILILLDAGADFTHLSQVF